MSEGLVGIEVDNVEPQVVLFVFHGFSLRDSVGFRPTAEFGVRQPPFFRTRCCRSLICSGIGRETRPMFTSDFVYSSMACFAIAFAVFAKRFRYVEELLQPSFTDAETSGFHVTFLQSNMKCDGCIRKGLYAMSRCTIDLAISEGLDGMKVDNPAQRAWTAWKSIFTVLQYLQSTQEGLLSASLRRHRTRRSERDGS